MNKDYKNDVIRRLKIAEGHLKKIIQMVEDDEYCIDVLQQTTAVKNAIKKSEEIILDGHLHGCVINAIKKDKSDASINELLDIFKRMNK